jgi:hypothetical protein
MNRYLSRKFVTAILTLISVHWALIERLISAGDYKAVVLGVVAAYMAGNVVQKAVEKGPAP